ncbi:MAG: 50S ribosomal protein L6 [Candidatus Moranbacteria bacterium]|nr:50S ribosomal protein L6 [Candidatus Moranbacteria bacterium]
MSRIGQKPVEIPKEVNIEISSGVINVKGNKGELSMLLHDSVSIKIEDDSLTVSKKRNSKIAQAMNGTTVRLIQNMITGVSKGFEKKLELNGVGFRMALKGKQIDLALGFSHPVLADIPEGINVNIEGMIMVISGIDKQKVGQFAAEIRSLKPVEPYKGKGFKYDDEIVRRKEGKKAVASA